MISALSFKFAPVLTTNSPGGKWATNCNLSKKQLLSLCNRREKSFGVSIFIQCITARTQSILRDGISLKCIGTWLGISGNARTGDILSNTLEVSRRLR